MGTQVGPRRGGLPSSIPRWRYIADFGRAVDTDCRIRPRERITRSDRVRLEPFTAQTAADTEEARHAAVERKRGGAAVCTATESVAAASAAARRTE